LDALLTKPQPPALAELGCSADVPSVAPKAPFQMNTPFDRAELILHVNHVKTKDNPLQKCI
jgi:hypothetical protein